MKKATQLMMEKKFQIFGKENFWTRLKEDGK